VENGATDIDQAFYFAAHNSKLDIIAYLLEKGANINSEQKFGGYTALHTACNFGDLEVVTFLADNNADLVLSNLINFMVYLKIFFEFLGSKKFVLRYLT
jgi:ankyrin repeat protein